MTDDEGRPLRKCDHLAAAPAPNRDVARAARRLILYRAAQPGPFTISDAVGASFAGGNSLGGVVSGLAAQGRIVRVGTTHAERVSRHGSTTGLWVGSRYGPAPARHSEPIEQALPLGGVDG